MKRLSPLPKELSADLAQPWRLAVVQILRDEEAVAMGKQKAKPNYRRRVLRLLEWIIAMLYLRSSSQKRWTVFPSQAPLPATRA